MNWDSLCELDEDAFDIAMSNLKPDEFYFQLDMGDFVYADHRFSITPKSYFDKTGYLLDSEFPTHTLPAGFESLCDSTFTYNGDSQIGRQLLLQAGFIEKKMF